MLARLIRPFNCPSEVIKLNNAAKSRLASVNIRVLRTSLMDSLMTHLNPPLVVIGFYMTSNSTGTLEIQANPLENTDPPN